MTARETPAELVTITLRIPPLLAKQLAEMKHGYTVVAWTWDPSRPMPIFVCNCNDIHPLEIALVLERAANLPFSDPVFRGTFGVTVDSLTTRFGEGGAP